jgi:hypothetical protein
MAEKMRVSITKEKTIEVELRRIPLEKIKLDDNNVRFKYLDKKLTYEQMEELIWKEKPTKELYGSILAAGGLREPPIVQEKNGEIIVREGNRRIVCLRKLSEKAHRKELGSFSESHFDIVQCLVWPPDAPESDMAIYLATRHVSGILEWDAVCKARHIYDLYYSHGYTLDDIKSHLGMSKGSVIMALEAYDATAKYGQLTKDPDWVRKYTYFDELYKKRRKLERKGWFDTDGKILPEKLETFMKWVRENRFNYQGVRDVRSLPELLEPENADALSIFETEGMKSAIRVLEAKMPEATSVFYKKMAIAIETLKTAPASELEAAAVDPIKLKYFQDIFELAKSRLDYINMLKKTEKNS